MFSPTVKKIAAFLFLPFLAALFYPFFSAFFSLAANIKTTLFFFLGILVYAIFHYFSGERKSYFYVLGHELSHALSGLLMGVKIKKISVKKNHGYVLFKGKTDSFTALAPYITPFYAMSAALLYFFAGFFFKVKPWLPFFIFAQGFFLAFHLAFTADIMSGPPQSDFKKAGGVFFSYVFVITVNLLFLFLILKLLFPELINLRSLFKIFAAKAGQNLSFIAGILKYAVNTAKIYTR